MNPADTPSITSCFPVVQILQHQRKAEAAMTVDAGLARLCRRLRYNQAGKPGFGSIAPQDWATFNREGAILGDLVRRIAAIPATSRIVLGAKALALHALLDDGYGDTYVGVGTAWAGSLSRGGEVGQIAEARRC
jgi:hypothetical protein